MGHILFLITAGVSVRRNERGLWLGVASARADSPALRAGLRSGDFITSINGRLVFHLKPEEVSRLIKTSGQVSVSLGRILTSTRFCFQTLYLDVERNNSKRLLYCNGLHQYSFNFLFEDNWEEKSMI